MRTLWTKIAAGITTIAMTICLIPANTWDVGAETATTLKNPVIEDGVTTWDCVYFGSYPQSSDGNGGFVTESIKWRVLSVDGNDLFLVADKNLDAKTYNETFYGVTWENSTVRSWLNGYDDSYNKDSIDFTNDSFINVAFSRSEQKSIIEKNLENEGGGHHQMIRCFCFLLRR